MSEINTDWHQSRQIDKHKAIRRIKRWLELFKTHPKYGVHYKHIPRGMMIEMEDIDQLRKKYEKSEKGKLIGIRIYFGLTKDAEHEGHVFNDLRGCIVPVFQVGDSHRDLVSNSNPDDTAVYDFTTPCPRTCDEQSELYVKIDI